MHLAYSMEPIFYETDLKIYDADMDQEDQIKDDMVIILRAL